MVNIDVDMTQQHYMLQLLKAYKKNPLERLKHISGPAKRIKDVLLNPDNSIYNNCRSFDEIYKEVENNSEGRLSAQSMITIASHVTYAKDIPLDDSCLAFMVNRDSKLSKLGINSANVQELYQRYSTDFPIAKFLLFLLSVSSLIYKSAKSNCADL